MPQRGMPIGCDSQSSRPSIGKDHSPGHVTPSTLVMNSDVLPLGLGMVLFVGLLMNVGASSVGLGAKGIPTEPQVAFEVLERPTIGS